MTASFSVCFSLSNIQLSRTTAVPEPPVQKCRICVNVPYNIGCPSFFAVYVSSKKINTIAGLRQDLLAPTSLFSNKLHNCHHIGGRISSVSHRQSPFFSWSSTRFSYAIVSIHGKELYQAYQVFNNRRADIENAFGMLPRRLSDGAGHRRTTTPPPDGAHIEYRKRSPDPRGPGGRGV